MDAGEVKVKLTGDVGGLNKAISQAEKSIDSFAKGLGGKLGPAGAALGALGPTGLAAAAGIGAVAAAASAVGIAISTATNHLIQISGTLSDLASKTGGSTQALQKLGFAGSLVGVSLGDVGSAANKMAANVANGSTAFERLGLNLVKLKNQNTEQQFISIGKAIAGLKSHGEQAAAAMEVFGKSTLLPLFKSDMAAAVAEAEKLGIVLSDKTVAAGDALGDEFTKISAAVEGFSNEIASSLVESEQFRQVVEGIKEGIGSATQFIRDHKGDIQDFASGLGLMAEGFGDAASGAKKLYDWLSKMVPALSVMSPLAAAIGQSFKDIAAAGAEAEKAHKKLRILATGLADPDFGGGDIIVTAPGGSFNSESAIKAAEAAALLKEQVSAANDVSRAIEEAAENEANLADSADLVAVAFQKQREESEETKQILADIADAQASDAGESADQIAANLQTSAEELEIMADAAGMTVEQFTQIQDKTQAWNDALGMAAGLLSSMPGLLGQIGSALGQYVSMMGQISKMGKGTGQFKNMSGGEKAQAGIMGVGGMVSAYKEGDILGGMATGASMGSMFGPWGTVIGAAVGAIVGLIGKFFGKPEYKKIMEQVGKDYGFAMSEGLAKSIEEQMEKLDIGRDLAIALNIGDLMTEGIAAGVDPTKFMPAVMELFDAIAAGTVPAAQGIEQLGIAFTELENSTVSATGMASQAMIDMIKQARALGIEVPEIAAYVSEQLDEAIAGVEKFINAVDFKSTFKIDSLEAQFDPLKGIVSGDMLQQRAEDAATIFSTTFWAVVAEKGMVAAAIAMGPAFNILKKKIKEAGLEMPEALMSMNKFFKLMENPEFRAAFEAIDGLSAALRGMTNAGYMTQEMFDAVSRSAENAFQKAIDMGLSEAEAFAAIAPFVQQILDMNARYGTAIPPWVQELINKHPEIKFETDPLLKVVELLTAIAEKLGAIPTSLETDYTLRYRTEGTPPPFDPGDKPPYDPGDNPPFDPGEKGYAGGGIAKGPDSGHWQLLHGTEAIIPMGPGGEFDFSSIPGLSRPNVSNSGNISVNVSGGDPQQVVRVIRHAIRNGELSASSQQYLGTP